MKQTDTVLSTEMSNVSIDALEKGARFLIANYPGISQESLDAIDTHITACRTASALSNTSEQNLKANNLQSGEASASPTSEPARHKAV